MKEKITRRSFLRSSTLVGFACCGLMFTNQALALKRIEKMIEDDEIIDPSTLNYCGYICPEDCKFLKATVENDTALKRKAYELWDLKNRYDVDFDPNKVFCYGCKNTEKPEGIYLQKCSVRNCAKEKQVQSCIECDELKECDKELWTRFPKFKEQVIEMQNKYKIQQG
jgi:uncharacterized protein DUF3795